uniref:Uncharacterized protein n=1 Tax=Anguilla anguilla TaxID=7936 RepID=A0A0E9PFB4_ANGAN
MKINTDPSLMFQRLCGGKWLCQCLLVAEVQ